MTQKIKIITLADLIFILLLGISGSASGAVASEVLYYLAFIIPISIGMIYIAKGSSQEGEKSSDTAKRVLGDFTITTDELLLSLPVTFIGIGITLLISMATSSVMELFGKENAVSFDEPFVIAVLIHALVPAVFEELLFRFIPVNLLRHKAKSAILLSSVFFAFAHANLFQIPYAFAAGLIFALLYTVTESIIPCILMHFLNNTFSLASIYGYTTPPVWISFAALEALSVCAVIILRNRYARELKKIDWSEKVEFGYPPIIFIILSLILAVSSLFA